MSGGLRCGIAASRPFSFRSARYGRAADVRRRGMDPEEEGHAARAVFGRDERGDSLDGADGRGGAALSEGRRPGPAADAARADAPDLLLAAVVQSLGPGGGGRALR